MNFSDQILSWVKPKSTEPSGVAVEVEVQLPRADLATFDAIFKMAQRLGLKGRIYMNLAGLITAKLEGPRRSMAAFYDQLTSGKFCLRQMISKFRRDASLANYKTLSQYFDDSVVNYLEKPSPTKPIAL